MRSRITRAGLATAATNVALAALYVLFASAQLQSFLRRPRASVLLIVAIETLFAIFFLLRRQATAASTSFVAWASTTAGTLLPLLIRPVPDARDLLVAQLVQVAGGALGVASILSLNRSLGLLPANRGVRVNGAYRLVRHPLYAAYLVTHLGYVASNFSIANVVAMTAALGAQLVRIRGEEQLLSTIPSTSRTRRARAGASCRSSTEPCAVVARAPPRREDAPTPSPPRRGTRGPTPAPRGRAPRRAGSSAARGSRRRRRPPGGPAIPARRSRCVHGARTCRVRMRPRTGCRS